MISVHDEKRMDSSPIKPTKIVNYPLVYVRVVTFPWGMFGKISGRPSS